MWIIVGLVLIVLSILGLAHVIGMATWLAVLLLIAGILLMVWDRTGSLRRRS